MAPPLLKTKLYIPPIRPELVSRPRLIERRYIALAYQLEHRVALPLSAVLFPQRTLLRVAVAASDFLKTLRLG